jgi:hypothetical protein
MPPKKELKFAFFMSSITTFIVTVSIAILNNKFSAELLSAGFLYAWLKTWGIAAVIVFLCILFVAPQIRKRIDRE